ncbi:MAG: hypothetical protein JO149_00025 [Gammaproteobacteria bacterium]|nr:hypothetical protein [Gammaproteobacteria bacterium]
MKKIAWFIFAVLFFNSAWAEVNLEPLLDKITLSLQSEQWVTTKTALVDVGVNAAVTDQGIEKVQATVLDKLNALAKGEWHIVSFNRQLDKSGLESVQINAQARLAQGELANLRAKAKTISKPGETYTIDNVQFTPSEEELRQANMALRNQVYQQAKAEVDALNKMYPEQKYYVHQVDFLMISPMRAAPMAEMNMMAKMAAAPVPLAVGNKVVIQANVVIASMPTQVTQKLTHNP